MNLFDSIKKVQNIVKKAVDKVAKENKLRKRVSETKREILSRFTIVQLERIATTKRISLYDEDPITGKRSRLRSKNEIVAKLASNLSFKDVVDLARRYKVKYSDVVQDFEKFKQKLFEEKQYEENGREILKGISNADKFDNKFEENISKIVQIIKEFEPIGTISKEEDLKTQLAQWISGKFCKSAVNVEYPFEHGRVDILVNDLVAIELKLANSKQGLKNLIGEVTTDKMYFSSVIAVIFDVGKDIDLEFFISQLKNIGVTTVIIPTQLKKSRYKQEIIIKKGKQRIVIS